MDKKKETKKKNHCYNLQSWKVLLKSLGSSKLAVWEQSGLLGWYDAICYPRSGGTWSILKSLLALIGSRYREMGSLWPTPDRILAAAFWISWELFRELLGHTNYYDSYQQQLRSSWRVFFLFLFFAAEQTEASFDYVELMTHNILTVTFILVGTLKPLTMSDLFIFCVWTFSFT